MSISESIKTTPVPTTRQESAFPQLRERLKKLSRLFRAMLALYLDDLLMLAGCACFVNKTTIK